LLKEKNFICGFIGRNGTRKGIYSSHIESGKYGKVLENHYLDSVKEIESSFKCLSCGFELLEDDNFCPGCGKRIGRR
jgi:rubrerythrin